MSWDLSFGKSFRIVVIKVKVRGTKFPKRELDEFWDGRIFLDSGLTVLSYQFFERILIFYKSLRGGGVFHTSPTPMPTMFDVSSLNVVISPTHARTCTMSLLKQVEWKISPTKQNRNVTNASAKVERLS